MIDECFGTLKDKRSGRKGLLEIGSGEAVNAREVFLDHVAIDRITQTAAAEKKFALCALDSPRFELSVSGRLPMDRMYGGALLALLLRDLMKGRMWVGSGVTRGYGKVRGASILQLRASLVEKAAEWKVPKGARMVTAEGMEVKRPGRIEVKVDDPSWEDLMWLWTALDGFWQQVRNRDVAV